MIKQAPFRKTILFATLFALGCTGSGAVGCGGDGANQATPMVESALFGVYAIDSYQGTSLDVTGPDACEQLSDIESPAFAVLYSFRPNENPDEARLGGVFCGDVEECQDVAERAPVPSIGYSFLEGNDQNGWRGFGISRAGAAGDQCVADVQTHTLTSSGQTITIDTVTVETTFMPMLEGETATCRNGDALQAITPELPCKARLILEATRTSDL